MILKSLEIYGFKSFAKRTIIKFDRGITGIVGPNGSGKSNILDAIRWVLGEQSPKTLRGGRMEDIIFAGTQNRRPLGFAEVSLTLDNSNETLEIEYTEITITRRLYRSGESEYYINKALCRLKDIYELFMDTGVGTDGYSIIGQGQIDQILSSNAQDRRSILEEASGIVKYKNRREEAIKKLTKTKDNLIRVDDIIHEISTQIDPLKKESERAKSYLKIREELKLYELNRFLRDYDKLSGDIYKNQEQKKLLKIEEDKDKALLKKNHSEREGLEKSIKDLDLVIEEYNNKRHNLDISIKTLEGDIRLNNERIEQGQRRIRQGKTEKKEEMLELSQKEDRIARLEKELKSESEHRDELLTRKESYMKELADINERLNKVRENLNTFRQAQETQSDEAAKIREQIIYMETRLQSADARSRELQAKLGPEQETLYKKENELKDNDKRLKRLKQSISAIRWEIEEKQQVITILRNEKSNLEDKIMTSSKELENNRTRYTFLKNMQKNREGYYKSVKRILDALDKNRLGPNGVRGVVAQLMRVPKDLERAIEMALGSSMQFIVTETEDDAKIAVNYLKTNKFGRATFLPLTSIKGRYLSKREEHALAMNGVVGVASQLISYDDKYKDIFNYLLGRVLIAESLDDAIIVAKKFSHTFKLVTLGGDLINPGGSISGGSSPDINSSILSRHREIKELRNNLKTIQNDLDSLYGERKIITENLEQHKEDLKRLQERKTKTEMKLAILRENIKALNIDIENIRANRLSNLEEIDKMDDERVNIQAKIDAERSRLSKNIKDMNNINDQVDKLGLKEEEILGDKEIIEGNITAIRIELASVEQKISSKIENKMSLEKDMVRHNDNINKKTKQIEENIQLCKVLKYENIENSKEIKHNDEKIQIIEKEIQALTINKKDMEDNIRTLKDKYRQIQERISQLLDRRHKTDVRISRMEVALDNIQNKIWDTYDISYNSALKFYDEKLSNDYIDGQIRKLKMKIKDLGEVSIGSIEQYRELNMRYKFLQSQKLDLETAMDDLKEVIEDITKTMEEQFKHEIRIISECFNEVFQELFGGGRAKLRLKDEQKILDSEIEIEAQPPGKKLQNISLLSGGEKALTAISLLFGILKRKPCPFCVLDEIDAPLDEGNLEKFCKFFNNFTDNTQFIIITHRRATMGVSNALYGVIMEEKGISDIVSVRLDDLAS
ncbi:MAG: chromosome segregation protein SMC [Clostridiales bacterium]|nr:chromosome segregation protein SMC [Clostridiales bacterium]